MLPQQTGARLRRPDSAVDGVRQEDSLHARIRHSRQHAQLPALRSAILLLAAERTGVESTGTHPTGLSIAKNLQNISVSCECCGNTSACTGLGYVTVNNASVRQRHTIVLNDCTTCWESYPRVAAEVCPAGVCQAHEHRVQARPVQQLANHAHAYEVVQRLKRALHCTVHCLRPQLAHAAAFAWICSEFISARVLRHHSAAGSCLCLILTGQ